MQDNLSRYFFIVARSSSIRRARSACLYTTATGRLVSARREGIMALLQGIACRSSHRLIVFDGLYVVCHRCFVHTSAGHYESVTTFCRFPVRPCLVGTDLGAIPRSSRRRQPRRQAKWVRPARKPRTYHTGLMHALSTAVRCRRYEGERDYGIKNTTSCKQPFLIRTLHY